MKNKILKSFLSIVFSICLIATTIPFSPTKAFAIEGNMIDVSSNNGTVDWDEMYPYVKDAGVIIRLGFGSDIESQDDSQFERNVAECERLRIPYGIYLYSYALDYDDLNSEIEHTLRMASQCNPVRGVWFDMEDADGYKQRHGINVYSEGNMLTDFCVMFISAMRDNGYDTGVYANYNYFTNVLNLDRLKSTKGFQMWLAHWCIDEPSMECKIWQFGDFGYPDKAFDGNIWYGDFKTEIKPASEVDYSEIYEKQIDDSVDTYYQVKVGGEWLSIVENNEDYAGIYGEPITDVAISVSKGYAEYRVHSNGRWLGWINTNDTNIDDYINGYAGNGKPIDGIQVYYHTPDSLRSSGAQWARYYTSSTDKTDGYYSGQWDTSTDDGMDGYAGVFGRPMDAIVLTVEHR